MFTITSIFHLLVGCRKYILHGKKGKVILPSQLDDKWLINLQKPNLNKIKLLYIGRIRKEKGIFSLINLIGKININLSLTIVGAEKEYVNFINKKNINILNIENDKKKLIKLYDDHNIFVLPSYTEGHPMVLLEALARLRPVIIFKEIKHVIQNKNGIFVSKRNYLSLNKTIKHIIKHYSYIQKDMKKNILPTKKDFIFSLKNIILNM